MVTTPVCVIGSLFAPAALASMMMLLAALPPIVTILAYFGFALFAADRLQSEEFVLQQQWFAAQIGDNETKQIITLEGEAAEPGPNISLTEAGQK